VRCFDSLQYARVCCWWLFYNAPSINKKSAVEFHGLLLSQVEADKGNTQMSDLLLSLIAYVQVDNIKLEAFRKTTLAWEIASRGWKWFKNII
jgi:hypothetical protein